MTAPPRKKITLNDVADHCGVSYQTVSRVLNEHPHVATETRARVLRAIVELGYRPNYVARSLATHRTHTIGMVSFGMTYYGPAQMTVNIESALKAKGYRLAFSTLDALTSEQLRDAIDHLLSQVVDGLVMITPITDVNLDMVQELCAGVPVVMIDIRRGEQVPSVVIDQRHGAMLATQHLIELGHRHICEISGPLSWCDAEQRHQGWQRAMRAARLALGQSIEGDWSAAGGYRAAQELLELNVPMTALVVGNDQMALGAIRALRERGLHVPQDISVTGFDDVPEAAFYDPPLTTVQQDFKALGLQSVEYLINLIENEDTPPHQRVLYPKLIERGSTCAPPDKPKKT